MKDKLKFDFSDDEKSLVIKALSMLRNILISQNRATIAVDEILLRLGDKNKIELDRIETNIIINALNNLRKFIKTEHQSPTDVNDVLLKLIDETDKKKVFLRK